MLLNLDQNFKPINDTEITFKYFTFSGGEPHIKIEPNFDVNQTITITTRLNSFNDVGLLCLAVDALKRMRANQLKLIIPYFPAARQDRLMQLGEPLSVKVYADIINHLAFEEVSILDAHSEVTLALIDNCSPISNHKFIEEVLKEIETPVIFASPDGGALKKIYKLSEYLGGIPVIECSKNRDVKTGKLTGFKVFSDDLQQANILIVDDICDGGGTFIGLAQELKNKNAGNLYLAVTHGIFNKGFAEMEHIFTKIFTTDSFKDFDNSIVHQIKLNERLLS